MIFNTGGGVNATRKVTGKSLHLANTAGGKYKNIKLVGASVQNGTPTVSKPVDIVSNKNFLPLPYYSALPYTTQGVTFTDAENGKINVNGTSTGDAYVDLYNNRNEMLTKEPIVFSKSEVDDISLFYFERVDDAWTVSRCTTGTQTEMIITPASNATGQIFRIGVQNGKTVNNVTVKPMIRLASISDDTYEPYTAITAELDETYTLNGINGIYDEIDLERGVRIQRCGVQVFKGSESWVGSSYLNGRYGININSKASGICMCSMAINKLVETVNCCHINQSGSFYINTSFNDVAEWKAHLTQNNMTVVYELKTPVETPLSVDELIAFNKLRAYKSGSSLLNSGSCDMEVEYFLNNKVGQPMADTHMNTAKYILDGATLNIIV